MAIFITELLNTTFSGTISLFSFTLCLSHQYCTLIPVHLLFGLHVHYIFIPLMVLWLAIFHLSLIKCKGCTCSHKLTILYIITVALTTSTLYIIAVSFLDGQKWCLSIYEGDKVTEGKPLVSFVAVFFILGFIWTLAMLVILFLYSVNAVFHDQSLTTSRRYACQKISTLLCAYAPLILLLSAVMFTNAYVHGIGLTKYSGGWMIVAISLPSIFSDLAGLLYPIFLLSAFPMLAARWKAIISGLSSIAFKYSCLSQPCLSFTKLHTVSDAQEL